MVRLKKKKIYIMYDVKYNYYENVEINKFNIM